MKKTKDLDLLNSEIVWLEPQEVVESHRYLRTATFEHSKKKLTINMVRRGIKEASKLFGYKLIEINPEMYNCYTYLIYYLKEHDVNYPLLFPYEAVDSVTLKPLRRK